MAENFTSAYAAPLDDLEARLKAAAQARGFAVSTPQEMTRTQFRGGDGGPTTALPASDLPSEVRAMQFDRYTFLIAALPDLPSLPAVQDSVRRFRNQCVIARSFLSANEALDLQGVLLAPRGSANSDEWKAIGLMVERDDRVARKFVWLRPEDPVEDDAGFDELLKRSALARPWEMTGQFSTATLDDTARFIAELEPGVPLDIIQDWVQLALNGQDNPIRLVDDLIKAAQARRAA